VQAGLSIGQAARLIGVERPVIEEAEKADVGDLASGLTTRMAEVYHVDPDWMLGVKDQYDRESMKGARGYDALSKHDKDIVDEFAASMSKKPPKTLAQIAEERSADAVRREAFVQGFIAAKDPKTAAGTLLLCAEADAAYIEWRKTRS